MASEFLNLYKARNESDVTRELPLFPMTPPCDVVKHDVNVFGVRAPVNDGVELYAIADNSVSILADDRKLPTNGQTDGEQFTGRTATRGEEIVQHHSKASTKISFSIDDILSIGSETHSVDKNTEELALVLDTMKDKYPFFGGQQLLLNTDWLGAVNYNRLQTGTPEERFRHQQKCHSLSSFPLDVYGRQTRPDNLEEMISSKPLPAASGLFKSCRLRRHRSDRKPRQPFTADQLETLERAFCRQPYLTVGERLDVALSLGIDEQRVKIWFQNRRAKCRRIAEARVDERNRSTLIVAAAASVAAVAAAAADKSTSYSGNEDCSRIVSSAVHHNLFPIVDRQTVFNQRRIADKVKVESKLEGGNHGLYTWQPSTSDGKFPGPSSWQQHVVSTEDDDNLNCLNRQFWISSRTGCEKVYRVG